MKKHLQCLFLMLIMAVSAFAQDRAVTGTVTAKEDGLPLPGVSVVVKGTQIGTQTDANGRFSLRVPSANNELEVRFIGYTTQTVTIGANNTVSVALVSDTRQLGEVVVTALGIERQKREIGYATTSIDNGALTEASPVNVANGLQGKVSGLNVTSLNNGVFENVKINLRGMRSLTGNNNPLLVLDGVPADLNYLSSINPNDVENVSVLKGSSAAAIYGPDARNGVIILTTKKGTKDKPVISFSNSTQFQQISFFPKLQTQFGQGGYGQFIPYENWSWGPAYDGSTVSLGHELPDGTQPTVTYSPTDERKNFFDTGVTTQNDISFGAKDFYLSVQDAFIKGIVPDDKNRRTGVRLNTSKEYGIFKAGFNANYIQQNYNVFNDQSMSDYFRAQSTGGNDGLMSQIFNTAAHIPISKFKDFKNDPLAQYNTYYNDYGLNPYFAIDNWRNKGKRDDLLTNIQLDLKPLDWLNFTYRAGLTSRTIVERNLSGGEEINQYAKDRALTRIPGAAEERAYKSSRLSSELFGNMNKEINEDFRTTAVLGTYIRQSDIRDSRVGAANLVVPELYNVTNRTGELTGSSPESRSRLFSLYGSAGLSYKGWANIEVTGRNDWTSVLSVDNNSFFYPGVSGSLVLTDALGALQDNNILSYLKLRASWNKTGNADISPYSLAATFSQPAGFPFGSLAGFTANNTTYNPDLKPEFIKSTEFGIESSFLNDRLNFEATYFNNDNTNQIISVRVSDATGYTSAFLNAASFINKGVELDMRLTPLVSFNKGNLQFRANATYNDSEVTSVYPGLDEISVGGYTRSSNYAIKGHPAFVWKSTDYLRDNAGHVIVNAQTGYPSEDPNPKVYGRTMPKWIIGLNPSANWNNFSLSALFEYKGGHQASFFGMGTDMAWTGVSAATARNSRERFVMPNSVYEDPAKPGTYLPNTNITIEDNNKFYTSVYRNAASNFLVSAASWRFRELSLAYNVPMKYLQNQKFVKGLDLALTGRNLFLWVPETNEYMDPDFSFYTTGNSSGIVNSQINPPVRTYGFNVNLKF